MSSEKCSLEKNFMKNVYIKAAHPKGYVVRVPLDERAEITYYSSVGQFTIAPHPCRKGRGWVESKISDEEFATIKLVAENINQAEKTLGHLSKVLEKQD